MTLFRALQYRGRPGPVNVSTELPQSIRPYTERKRQSEVGWKSKVGLSPGASLDCVGSICYFICSAHDRV